MACVYNDKKYEILQGAPDCLDWAKRQCPEGSFRDSLFLYRAVSTGKFMLARWLQFRCVFIPLLEISDSLQDFDAATADRWRRYLHPQPDDNISLGMKQAEAAERRAAEEFDVERRERREAMLRDELGIKVRRSSGLVYGPTGMLDR